MQEYLDIVIKYWFIFLPLTLAIIIVLWLLIKKGYLQEVNLFGFKFDLNRDFSRDRKYLGNPQKGILTLRDYEIKFTKNSLANVSALSITQETVIRLVENEFTNHVNYFKWDLSDYPLPVKDGYIVVLDKVGNTVTFHGVKHADFNELELASLNDLLAIYRRLSRFEYRRNKDFILRTETIAMIVDEHKEIIRRLIRHYEIFRRISLPGKENFPMLFLGYLSDKNKFADAKSEIEEFDQKLPSSSKGFGLNVVAAVSALFNIEELVANEENGLISQDESDKEIVLCMERSLQYIHKMINAVLNNI